MTHLWNGLNDQQSRFQSKNGEVICSSPRFFITISRIYSSLLLCLLHLKLQKGYVNSPIMENGLQQQPETFGLDIRKNLPPTKVLEFGALLLKEGFSTTIQMAFIFGSDLLLAL